MTANTKPIAIPERSPMLRTNVRPAASARVYPSKRATLTARRISLLDLRASAICQRCSGDSGGLATASTGAIFASGGIAYGSETSSATATPHHQDSIHNHKRIIGAGKGGR